MSTLRARCPDCRTLTAVAIGPDYQCHACGREFGAGLVRLGTAVELPWPEAATEVTGALPARPLVVGGRSGDHDTVARALGDVPVIHIAGGEADGRFPPGAYVAVAGEPADFEALEQLLASIPSPRGAGFIGFGDSELAAERLTRLAHALGL
jgi:hypothetical protein